MDMTGGIMELKSNLNLTSTSEYDQTWAYLSQMFYKKSMMGCMLPMKSHANGSEIITDKGLVHTHAFTITKFASLIDASGKEVRLVRIKNPWASEIEWNGAWGDLSVEWNRVSDEDKQRLEFRARHDGEFWMCFEDFMRTWSRIELCHISCDSFLLNDPTRHFKTTNKAWTSMCEDAWKSSTVHFTHSEMCPAPICLIRVDNTANNLTDGFKTIIISMTQKDAHLAQALAKPHYQHNNIFLFKLYHLPDLVADRLESSSVLCMDDPLAGSPGKNWKKPQQLAFSFEEIVKVAREFREVQEQASRFC